MRPCRLLNASVFCKTQKPPEAGFCCCQEFVDSRSTRWSYSCWKSEYMERKRDLEKSEFSGGGQNPNFRAENCRKKSRRTPRYDLTVGVKPICAGDRSSSRNEPKA